MQVYFCFSYKQLINVVRKAAIFALTSIIAHQRVLRRSLAFHANLHSCGYIFQILSTMPRPRSCLLVSIVSSHFDCCTSRGCFITKRSSLFNISDEAMYSFIRFSFCCDRELILIFVCSCP